LEDEFRSDYGFPALCRSNTYQGSQMHQYNQQGGFPLDQKDIPIEAVDVDKYVRVQSLFQRVIYIRIV
jgi:hypothetical protein